MKREPIYYSDAPQQDAPQTPRKDNRNKSYDSHRWNGYSDPDDFPTDGYDNNGW